jgi:hypothetical protein
LSLQLQQSNDIQLTLIDIVYEKHSALVRVEHQSGEVSGKREIAPTLRGGSHATFFTFPVSRDLNHTPNWLTHILIERIDVYEFISDKASCLLPVHQLVNRRA